MLTREDNEFLTSTRAGTPMGDLLREYWMPAVRSAALEADGAPKRVRLLGENYVAFRSTDGRVGFFDEGCPHRCTSLALARNEDNALTCIFHGWKIDVSGKVVEVPSEPPERRTEFAAKVRVRHYPVREAGLMVWVYLGKRADPPPFPMFEYNNLPAGHVHVRRAMLHYNWVQGLEAHIDSSHLGILHSGFIKTGTQSSPRDLMMSAANTGPRFEFDITPYGIREGALRDQGNGTMYARIRQIVLPFFTFIPANVNFPCSARATIPIDDEWDAEWYIIYDPKAPLTEQAIATAMWNTSGDLDNFASNLGGFDDMWKQDRRSMKEGHWSGLGRNIPFEDFTVEESMGPKTDRTREYLGSSDTILIRARRLLMEAARAYAAGKPAPWQENIDYNQVRALAIDFPVERDWRSLDVLNAFARA
ncbi:MAG TPA: Rieske 2Fe-2S domain-containing protein [Candidatus Binataceae bacterium]|nr:Rieske 2Fe-2S domain-containing protein [Candidatus Binataceae bacterium]